MDVERSSWLQVVSHQTAHGVLIVRDRNIGFWTSALRTLNTSVFISLVSFLIAAAAHCQSLPEQQEGPGDKVPNFTDTIEGCGAQTETKSGRGAANEASRADDSEMEIAGANSAGVVRWTHRSRNMHRERHSKGSLHSVEGEKASSRMRLRGRVEHNTVSAHAHSLHGETAKERSDSMRAAAGEALYGISVYEGTYPGGGSPHHFGYHPRDAWVDVVVTKKDRPIVLFLRSYETVTWRLQVEPGVRIKSVTVISYHHSTASGVPEDAGTKVYCSSYEIPSTDKNLSYERFGNFSDGSEAIRAKEVMGEFVSYQYRYRGELFKI